MSVRTYYLIFVLWNTSCVFLRPHLYLTNWDKLKIVDWNVWAIRNWQWCELCHYSVTPTLPVHNIHHKALVRLYHPHLLTCSGQRVSGVFLAHLPQSLLQADSPDDISGFTKLPITLLRSCSSGQHMLRHGHGAVMVIRSDRGHVTRYRRDRNTFLHCLHFLCLRWSKHFHIPKVTTIFTKYVLLHLVA